MTNRPLTAALLTACLLALAACGASSSPSKVRSATVLLDWTANPAHSGILTALAKGLDRKQSVAVTLRTPSSSADGVRLLLANRADLAVMDIHDLAIARERGRDLVGVMSIVGHPLAAVIASPQIKRPRDLAGRDVAVTGVPSDAAVTKAIIQGDGGDPSKVTLRNTGFGAVAALLGGRTSAAIGFFNEEGVAVTTKHPGYHVFRLDQFGSPAYPELVLVTTRQKLDSDSALVASVVRAFIAGTEEAEADPAQAALIVRRKIGSGDPTLFPARMKAALAAILPPDGSAGSLDLKLLAQWATWEITSGLVTSKPDVNAAFDARFLN